MKTKEVIPGKKTVRISKAADLEAPQVYETKIPWKPKPWVQNVHRMYFFEEVAKKCADLKQHFFKEHEGQ